jgi:alkanesulfonate monooxygenase SsuD/methylene tetrahydromethanopterin reductase-like flavin-dependent oxidoreductase (luciferase family)
MCGVHLQETTLPGCTGVPMTRPEPFGHGSISLGLYCDPAPAPTMIDHLLEQATAADRAGVPGVTISEHHAGFPAYVPNPVHVAGWILAETATVWAGPNPAVLTLYPAARIAEEIAWMAARFPGRVGLGVAPGYTRTDFDAYGADFEERGRAFEQGLRILTSALRGEAPSPLGDDPALVACARRPIVVCAAAGSLTAARRAARAGAGILTDSLATVDRARELFAAYDIAGGTGPRTITRRIWVGDDPPLQELAAQVGHYRATAGSRSWLSAPGSSAQLVHGDPDDVAATLRAAISDTGATALALKIHLIGVAQGRVLDQIAALGDVLARLGGRVGAAA